MKEYNVKKIDDCKVKPDSPVWSDIKPANIDCFPWSGYTYKPASNAKLVHSDNAITVRFETDEKPLSAAITQDNSDVCSDSCVEFFFRPVLEDDRYINIEINPLGTMHIGIGNVREGRKLIDFDKAIFEVTSIITVDKWILQYVIPQSFIIGHFGSISKCFYGNFYKCGDKTGHVHYGCWNTVETKTPDFHRPEYFGKIIFE